MNRLLLATGALLAFSGAAHASQLECFSSEYVHSLFAGGSVHTSGLASTTLGTPTDMGSDPLNTWCNIQSAGDTLDSTVIDATGKCIASSGSAYRVIERGGVFRISSGSIVVVAMNSQTRSVGSQALDSAAMTLVASGSYILPKVTGVAGEELDWNCQIISTAFRPAIP